MVDAFEFLQVWMPLVLKGLGVTELRELYRKGTLREGFK